MNNQFINSKVLNNKLISDDNNFSSSCRFMKMQNLAVSVGKEARRFLSLIQTVDINNNAKEM